ncbi:S41 family peptidase [Kibdelosporangium persicum]|uniref:Interphotoreceptor retinoid-binding protein n=1 Tax=Kibdelosporangium persicum TaxID=2698649 RepID=A0ABX2FFZ5_9PSEU|nr:S41 family peptidase [Kibdelosporangium persicum]NRN70298.1 Interphotoreceptor retinoid-binding protein [Kibdelosporangium persicum]
MGTDWAWEIETISRLVAERYVFPDVAESIVEVLSTITYDHIDDAESFAAAVTADLQSVNGDQHLRVEHQATEIVEGPADEQKYRQEAELDGHGIAAVRRLDGNVGLLDIRTMHSVAVSGAAAVAAMNLLAATDVLLIDLRRNRGGDPAMVALLCSFLFDVPTHLNDVYSRPHDGIGQFWTSAYVPGPKFGADKPVYVLTSAETFSGGEELANDLRELKRATLVGEVTRGGAHPAGAHRVSAHLRIKVPWGRAINPVSGTNWEGVGVQPHIAVPADEAFDTAYRLAISHVLELGGDGVRRAVADQARKVAEHLW